MQDDYQDYIKALNPELCWDNPPQYYDANVDRLRQERKQHYARVIKTQTPMIYVHAKHFSFSYKAFDGSSWTTQLRNIDVDKPRHGLTPQQHKLKDSLQTVLALSDAGIKLKWITPTTQDNQFDPTYQLLLIKDVWYCCIGDQFYAQSTVRTPPNRDHKEITFSTNNPPIFNQATVDALLDSMI
jgi:hypothetical protein